MSLLGSEVGVSLGEKIFERMKRIRGRGLVGGSVYLGFEVLKAQAKKPGVSFSACRLKCKTLSYFLSTVPACLLRASCHDVSGINL